MQPEALCAKFFQALQALLQLGIGEAVFRVARIAHDFVADFEVSAGVVAAADGFRNAAVLTENVNMGDIIEVDERAKTAGIVELMVGHGVGGEHDVPPGESAGVREHQFRVAGAVHAAALLLQNAKDSGVRQRLDGEIFLKIFAPCKRLFQRAGIAADSGFVVEVEGGRVLGGGIFKHRVRKRKIRHGSSLRLTYWIPRQYSTECGEMQVFLLYRRRKNAAGENQIQV